MNSASRTKHRKYDARMDCHYEDFCVNEKCYYCGERAQVKDHVPPLACVSDYGVDFFDQKRIKLFRVSACVECNATLGDKPIFDLTNRVEYLYYAYQKKYKKLLSGNLWDKDDLDELGYALRQYIENFTTARDWLERRLLRMEDIHELEDIYG